MKIPTPDFFGYTENAIVASIELIKEQCPADCVVWQHGNGLYACPKGTPRTDAVSLAFKAYVVIEIAGHNNPAVAPRVVHRASDPNGSRTQDYEAAFKRLSTMTTPKYFRDRKSKATK